MRRESQNSSIPVPLFQSGGGLLNHISGTYSHSVWLIIRDFRCQNCIWENFLTLEFQSWKVNFKTEVCWKSADPHITMHWIKEVEIAKINRRSCDIAIDCRAERFPRLRYAWCDDCVKSSVLKSTTDSYEGDKVLTRSTSISVQPEFMKQHKAVQSVSDLFNIRSQNDDVQDFDVRLDQALLSASEMPSVLILEGLYKSKLQDSVRLQTCFGFVWSRNH